VSYRAPVEHNNVVYLEVDGERTEFYGFLVQHPMNGNWRGETQGMMWTGNWHRGRRQAGEELSSYLHDLREKRLS
jgi:hypothetical protein